MYKGKKYYSYSADEIKKKIKKIWSSYLSINFK